MRLGTSYYPETYDSEVWENDLKLMKEAGLEVIRIFDFAWTTVEVREGVYEWTWLDTFLDLCDKFDLQVILCTPTATPPAWLAHQYPEIMSVRRNGIPREFGGRRGMCNTGEIYRYFSVGIAQKMAECYGQRKTVLGWQIDNELMGPCDTGDLLTECHCKACTFRFRTWLKKRYACVEDINKAWGLAFWNQGYGNWSEITTPLHDHCALGWIIDYTEFLSDMTAEFMKLQYDALKEIIIPEQWVVTNSTGVMNIGFDHPKFSRIMDAGAWDNYPTCAGTPLPNTYAGLAHEMFRSATEKPFHILESPSWDISQPFIFECFARGAESVLFWHWRCIPFGVEHHADTICHYDGSPKPGRIEAIKALKEKIDNIPSVPTKMPKQETAFIYSQTNVRVTRRQSNWRTCDYLTTLPKTYQPLWQHGVPVDVREPLENLEGYKLAVIPSLQLIDKDEAANLANFVRNGGILWACAPFAQRDHHAKWLQDTGGLVADMLGVKQLDTKQRGETKIKVDGVGEFEIEHSGQLIKPTTAEVLGTFADGTYAGEAAVTVNNFGKGKAFFAACVSQSLGEWLIPKAVAEAGIQSVENDCEDMTIIPHLSGKGMWYCNYSDSAQTVNGITIPANDVIFTMDEESK